ncbi:MAG: B12-binding domain-containing radical SAM protein [Spirochaetota bacterium]
MYHYPREGKVRAAVCYPNSYRAGMSNLGFHRLLHLVASYPGIRAARFFYESGRAWSPDSTSPLAGMDLLLFSVSFELDYLNLIGMLRQGGLPPLREERSGGPCRPVVAGGITVTANPQFLSPFADIICRGDMEVSLPPLLDLLAAAPFTGRGELLGKASDLPGVYVPENGGTGQRHGDVQPVYVPAPAHLAEISDPAHSVAITTRSEFARMFLVEVTRGCRSSCLFCMTRCANPFRSVPEERVVELAGRARGAAGKVGLIAPVVTDHPRVDSLVASVNRLGMKVSFSSLRADHFTPGIARLVRANGQRTVTFAPETGSVELRRSLGKPLADESLLAAVSLAGEHGVRRLRWYFMYGLPGEREGDLEAVGRLAREAVALLQAGGELVLSVNPFVPKKMTPLEDFPLHPPEYYRAARERLGRMLGDIPGVRARFESLRTLELHYHLSQGDGETGRLLFQCLREGRMREFVKAAGSLHRERREPGGDEQRGT